MAARRGNHPAPFEVMRTSGNAANIPDHSTQSQLNAPSAPHAKPQSFLRIPRGLVAFAVLVAILLIALSYWVGYSRGIAHQQATFADATTGTPDPRRPAQSNSTPSNAVSTPVTPPAKPVNPTTDPRIVGHNYLQLARLPAESGYAEKLIAFLKDHGVDAIAVFDDNKRFYLVYDLTGFTSDEVSFDPQSAYQQHKARLKGLGVQWKQAGGPSDMADMYYVKHKGD